MATSLRVIEIAIIILIILISISLTPVQAINNPSAKADISTITSTNKFTYGVNPVTYCMDSDTGKGYYLIDSIYRGVEHPSPKEPIIGEEDAIISITPNDTIIIQLAPEDIVETPQPIVEIPISRNDSTVKVMDIDKTMQNAYKELLKVINEKHLKPTEPVEHDGIGPRYIVIKPLPQLQTPEDPTKAILGAQL